MAHAHDPSNSVMNGRHTHDHAEGYKAVKDEDFKADAYPKYMHSLDASGQPVSVVVADPDGEKALEGNWFETPSAAMKAAKAKASKPVKPTV